MPSFPAPESHSSRRTFLRISAGAAFFGSASGLGALGGMGRVLAADAWLEPDLVRLNPEIEPTVRTIETTPRGKIVEAAAGLLKSGVDYKRFMTALFLAGIRNVDSSNSGFGFHCVLAINSAHLLAMGAPAEERLLPLFWALDDFKGAQQNQPRLMKPLASDPPEGAAAIAALREAVNAWDQRGAELALAGIARTCEPAEAFEELWRLGARDFRPIGHKAIFVAQTWRTLQTIGWQHAEPALRSLGRSLPGYGPKTNNNGIGFDDQCHAANEELVREHASKLPADWANADAAADAVLAAALLAPIRAAKAKQAGADAVALLIDGKARAGAIWDIVHLAAAELMYRRPGIAALHAVTSVNALHFGFRNAKSKETRLFMLLQAVGWMAHFTQVTGLTTADKPTYNILDLAPLAGGVADDPVEVAAGILSEVRAADGWATRTAARGFAYAKRHGDHAALVNGARQRVFLKATEAHQYKHPAAAFEDIPAVSAAWRPHLCATATLYLPANSAPDSDVIQRAKDAIKGL